MSLSQIVKTPRIWKIGCRCKGSSRKELWDYFQRKDVVSLSAYKATFKEKFKKEAELGDIVVVYNSGKILGVCKIVSKCKPDRGFGWYRDGYLRKVRWIRPFIPASVKENKILYSRRGFTRPYTFFKLPQDCVIELVRFLKKRGVNLLALMGRRKRERALEPSIQKPVLKKYQSRKMPVYNKKIERYSRDNIQLEKSSKNHQKILNRLANILKQQGVEPEDSKNIDLTCKTRGIRYIFEVKSCRSDNVVSQIRRGIAQLYEYRFLMLDEERNIKLFLVLEIEPPKQPIDFLKYLEEDRSIGIVWAKNQKLVCSDRTAKMLSHITMEEVK